MSQLKRDYTDNERKKIVNYIIDNKGFYSLRGNAFWKDMEKEKVVFRTWQSMKEHFRKKIINNLNYYDISKENHKKIIAGYNNTRTVERGDNLTTYVPKHKNFNFSDEEKEAKKRRSLSTSSDDSDDLVIVVDKNKPSTSKKEFKKQTIQKKSATLISDLEESSNNNLSLILEKTKCPKNMEKEKNKELITVNDSKELNTKQTDMIEIDATSPSISDINSDTSPSPNVSSTNLDEACVEFSIADDKKFLQALTKYDSNLLNCASIVTFIKQYTDHYVLCQDWTELYDRFIEILNNLQLYDYLVPETVTKLQSLKDPLEKYRSNGFQEPKIEILPVKLENEILKFTLAPDPDLIYLKKESLDLVSFLENIRSSICDVVEKAIAGEVSQETASDVIKTLTEFVEKYVPQRSIDNNHNCDSVQNVSELTQIVKEEIVNDEYSEIRIKEENVSLSIDDNEIVLNTETPREESISQEMPQTENQSDISDSISLQPEITINLSEIQCNSIHSSQYLEPLTTDELNVTNMVGKMIENDLDHSDNEFLTCESSL